MLLQGLSRFHPRKLPNGVLWLESESKYVSLDGSNNASAWQDRGIYNLGLTQSNAAKRLAYAEDQVNGLPALVNNGSDKSLSNSINLGTLTGATAYLVVKYNNTMDAQRAYNWANNFCSFLVLGNYLYWQSNTGGWGRVPFTNTQPVILAGRYDASQVGNARLCLRVNGQTQNFSSYGTAQPDSVAVSSLTVGSGSGNHLNGLILAAGFFSIAQSDWACFKVEQYLSDWSGISLV